MAFHIQIQRLESVTLVKHNASMSAKLSKLLNGGKCENVISYISHKVCNKGKTNTVAASSRFYFCRVTLRGKHLQKCWINWIEKNYIYLTKNVDYFICVYVEESNSHTFPLNEGEWIVCTYVSEQRRLWDIPPPN